MKSYEETIKERLQQRLDMNQDVADDVLIETIEDIVRQLSKEQYMTLQEKNKLIHTIYNAMRKLDALEPLLEDESITEIMINGPNAIFIERKGEIQKANVTFSSEEMLSNVIQKIVAKVNRQVNDASPIVDARLENGSRVNIVLPPIALDGATMTIRKFNKTPMTIEQLIAYQSITPEVAVFLQKLVKAKYNIFISGGTGSGKTTFLNALSNFIQKDERIITIEDSAELQIANVPNLVRLETRNANAEGKGEITIRDLIKASLRMRPDRIIVGEVRGAEALDMLQAMNTGHDGSLSTGHANSTHDILTRIETMVLTGAAMPIDAIRQQIASAIDIIIQLSRLRDRSRRVLEIVEIIGYQKGTIITNPLYRFQEEGETKQGKIIGTLQRTEQEMVHTEKLKMAGIFETL